LPPFRHAETVSVRKFYQTIPSQNLSKKVLIKY
jgi:hypothetical protein